MTSQMAFSWRSCAPAAPRDIKVFHPTAAEPGKAWAHQPSPHHCDVLGVPVSVWSKASFPGLLVWLVVLCCSSLG